MREMILSERTLAGTVAADNADHIALGDIKIDVTQRPQRLIRGVRLGRFGGLIPKSAKRPLQGANQEFAKIVGVAKLLAQLVLLRNVPEIMSAKRRSILRKIIRTLKNNNKETSMELVTTVQESGLPSKQCRKPSTIPAIGLIPRRDCQRSGM
jgi:hypothetical protein